MTRMTVFVEGALIAVRLGHKDVTSDFDVVDTARCYQCERCFRWLDGTTTPPVVGAQGQIWCPDCIQKPEC